MLNNKLDVVKHVSIIKKSKIILRDESSTIGITNDPDLIQLNDSIVKINGELIVNTLNIGGANVTATASEINVLSATNSPESITLVDTDKIIINNNNVMKQIPISNLQSYIDTPTNLNSLNDVYVNNLDRNVWIGQDPSISQITGTSNLSIGLESLENNESGSNNIALGNDALETNISGNNNIALGSNALTNVNSGDYNIAVGNTAGNIITSGDNNILIGDNANVSSVSAQNQIAIGKDSICTQNNQIVLGSPNTIETVLNGNVVNYNTPSSGTHLCNKTYVDGIASGLDIKHSVKVATTIDSDISNTFENGDTIDGVILVTNDRILIKDQKNKSENGIYIVKSSGTPDRASDLLNGSNAAGIFTFIEEGTINKDTGWVCTSDANSSTVNTHDLEFTQFNNVCTINAGTGLTKNGSTLNVNDTQTFNELTVDNIKIDGTTIGHTSDTNLITLGNGVVTIDGELSVTTLDIGGTNITASAKELNILDGNSSSVSTTIVDTDKIILNDSGTMVQVPVTNLDTYIKSTISITTLTDCLAGDTSIWLGSDPIASLVNSGFTVQNFNTGIGIQALDAITDGNSNVGIGYNALSVTTDGHDNVGVGSSALVSMVGGKKNIGIGTDALRLATSDQNIGIGHAAGNVITTGSANILIGYNTDPNTNNGTNQIVIGDSATGHGNNITVLGNGSCIAWHPHDTNEVDLGSSSYKFKDVYINGIVNCGGLNIGTMAYPTSDGTVNQILQTNGSGTLGWVTASGSRTIQYNITNDSSKTLLANSSLIIYSIPLQVLDNIYHASIKIACSFPGLAVSDHPSLSATCTAADPHGVESISIATTSARTGFLRCVGHISSTTPYTQIDIALTAGSNNLDITADSKINISFIPNDVQVTTSIIPAPPIVNIFNGVPIDTNSAVSLTGNLIMFIKDYKYYIHNISANTTDAGVDFGAGTSILTQIPTGLVSWMTMRVIAINEIRMLFSDGKVYNYTFTISNNIPTFTFDVVVTQDYTFGGTGSYSIGLPLSGEIDTGGFNAENNQWYKWDGTTTNLGGNCILTAFTYGSAGQDLVGLPSDLDSAYVNISNPTTGYAFKGSNYYELSFTNGVNATEKTLGRIITGGTLVSSGTIPPVNIFNGVPIDTQAFSIFDATYYIFYKDYKYYIYNYATNTTSAGVAFGNGTSVMSQIPTGQTINMGYVDAPNSSIYINVGTNWYEYDWVLSSGIPTFTYVRTISNSSWFGGGMPTSGWDGVGPYTIGANMWLFNGSSYNQFAYGGTGQPFDGLPHDIGCIDIRIDDTLKGWAFKGDKYYEISLTYSGIGGGTALIGRRPNGGTLVSSGTIPPVVNIFNSAAEMNILDGVTSTAAELNILDGVTSTAAELNILDGVTSTAAELNILDGVTSTAAELNILDGATVTTIELNILDGNTTATSVTLVDGDRVIVNDSGTMVQVALSDVKTYIGAGSSTNITGLSDCLVETDSIYIGNDPSSTTSTAQYNIAMGTTTLDAITTGDSNVAIGYNALTALTTSQQNIAIGKSALAAITTGSGVSFGNDNIAIGFESQIASNGTSVSKSINNVSIGNYSLASITEGRSNTVFGANAFQSAGTTSSYNTIIGCHSSFSVTGICNDNIIIGQSAAPSANGAQNEIVIGKGASGHGTDIVVIGNGSCTAWHPHDTDEVDLGSGTYRFNQIYAKQNTISTSDLNEKKEINNLILGLEFVTDLRPVEYKWLTGSDTNKHYGLIAQEVEMILNKNNIYNKKELINYDNDSKLYGIKYTELIAPLINAVKELDEKNKDLEQKYLESMKTIDAYKEENVKLNNNIKNILERLIKLENK